VLAPKMLSLCLEVNTQRNCLKLDRYVNGDQIDTAGLSPPRHFTETTLQAIVTPSGRMVGHRQVNVLRSSARHAESLYPTEAVAGGWHNLREYQYPPPFLLLSKSIYIGTPPDQSLIFTKWRGFLGAIDRSTASNHAAGSNPGVKPCPASSYALVPVVTRSYTPFR
jgi:hypothetical protein